MATTSLGGKGSKQIDGTPAVGASPISMVDHIEVRSFGTGEVFIVIINTAGTAVGLGISHADLQGLITVLQAQ